jgi:hypothetical protein
VADFTAIGLVALPVLVESDVEACRLLPGVVLSESCGTPAHHAAVPDPPHTRADVAVGHRAHRRPGPQTSRLHPVQALLRWTGQGACRNVGPPHPCREVLALPGSQNFQQYRHIDRSLTPPLMRPSLVLARKAVDRMWFRRHWLVLTLTRSTTNQCGDQTELVVVPQGATKPLSGYGSSHLAGRCGGSVTDRCFVQSARAPSTISRAEPRVRERSRPGRSATCGPRPSSVQGA